MSKRLGINNDVYNRLLLRKKQGDSFESVVVRILDKWEDFYGLSEEL